MQYYIYVAKTSATNDIKKRQPLGCRFFVRERVPDALKINISSALGLALLSRPALFHAQNCALDALAKSVGTLAGDAAWSPSTPLRRERANSVSAGSLDVPGPVVDTRQSFTVSAWVKLSPNRRLSDIRLDGRHPGQRLLFAASRLRCVRLCHDADRVTRPENGAIAASPLPVSARRLVSTWSVSTTLRPKPFPCMSTAF